MEISRKILIIITVIFSVFFLIVFGVGFGLGLKQKTQERPKSIQQEEQDGEKEAQIKECVKTVREIDFPELINFTEWLSKREQLSQELASPKTHSFNLLMKYLRCKISQEEDEDKKNVLIDYAMEANQRILFNNKIEAWESAMAEIREGFFRLRKSFTTDLAFGDMAEICPDELPVVCKKDNGIVFLESNEWCNNICGILSQYEKDKDRLDREVINFKDWGEELKGFPSSPFNWRLAVAYRFGGKDLALKICDNVVNKSKRDTCIAAAASFEVIGMGCDVAFEQLSKLICDYQYKNY